MKRLLLILCVLIVGCSSSSDEQQVVHKHKDPVWEAPPAPPAPPPPAPGAPVGYQTLPAQLKFIGSYKMNDCWSVNLWRDDANHVTCYFSECENVHLMSCVKDEVAPTK